MAKLNPKDSCCSRPKYPRTKLDVSADSITTPWTYGEAQALVALVAGGLGARITDVSGHARVNRDKR